MKKLIVVIISMYLVLSVGCGKTNTSSETKDTKENKVSGMIDNKNATSTPTVTPTPMLNLNLKGKELLQSLKPDAPKKLLLEGKSYTEATIVNTKTILYNENMRIESESSDGLSVMVYNSEKGVTYMYNDTTKKGSISRDGKDEDDQEQDDKKFVSGKDLIDSIEGLKKAEITSLNGEEVLYVETESNTGEGVFTTNQWISTKFWYPVKYETMFNGKKTSGYDTTKITDDFKIDDSMFAEPKGIEFMDIDKMFGDIDGM